MRFDFHINSIPMKIDVFLCTQPYFLGIFLFLLFLSYFYSIFYIGRWKRILKFSHRFWYVFLAIVYLCSRKCVVNKSVCMECLDVSPTKCISQKPKNTCLLMCFFFCTFKSIYVYSIELTCYLFSIEKCNFINSVSVAICHRV